MHLGTAVVRGAVGPLELVSIRGRRVAGLGVHRPFEWPPYDSGERQKLAPPSLSPTGATQALSNSGKSNEFASQIRRVQFTGSESSGA